MSGLKPETTAVIETGRGLLDVYNALTDPSKKTQVMWLMREHLVVAAHSECEIWLVISWAIHSPL